MNTTHEGIVERMAKELSTLKDELSKYKAAVEDKHDFIIWLFEESGELHDNTLNEMWDKFEIWNQDLTSHHH